MLSTEVIDEREAENHLRLAYQEVGLQPPQIRWFDSPASFLRAILPDGAWDTEQERVEDLVHKGPAARTRHKIRSHLQRKQWPTRFVACALMGVVLIVIIVVVGIVASTGGDVWRMVTVPLGSVLTSAICLSI